MGRRLGRARPRCLREVCHHRLQVIAPAEELVAGASEADNTWRVTVSFAYAGCGARSKLHVENSYVEPLAR